MQTWTSKNNGLVDYGPLINPPREPPPNMVRAIDALSWALPILSAILSISCGVLAFRKVDDWAAILGISAGIASACGVLFTGWASRIRDRRLAVAHSLGALGVDMADRAQSLHPNFD